MRSIALGLGNTNQLVFGDLYVGQIAGTKFREKFAVGNLLRGGTGGEPAGHIKHQSDGDDIDASEEPAITLLTVHRKSSAATHWPLCLFRAAGYPQSSAGKLRQYRGPAIIVHDTPLRIHYDILPKTNFGATSIFATSSRFARTGFAKGDLRRSGPFRYDLSPSASPRCRGIASHPGLENDPPGCSATTPTPAVSRSHRQAIE